MRCWIAFSAVGLLGSTAWVAGQTPSTKVDSTNAAAIARIEQLLGTIIPTKDLQDELPLPKMLAALQARVSEGKKFVIRIDGKAFGKDLPEVRGSMVHLPPVPKTMTVSVAIRLVLSQVATNEADYDIEPAG